MLFYDFGLAGHGIIMIYYLLYLNTMKVPIVQQVLGYDQLLLTLEERKQLFMLLIFAQEP